MLLAVILHPETERCIIDPELPRHLGNRQRVIDHLPGGLLLKLGRVSFPFSRHLFPFLTRRILFGSPVRKQRGTSRTCACSAAIASAAGALMVFGQVPRMVRRERLDVRAADAAALGSGDLD